MKYVVLLVAALSIACGGSEQGSTSAEAPAAPAPQAPGATKAPKIVFLGDSLTAGLGLETDRSYPSLIGSRLKQRGYDYEIVNAGVSGDTSAGGLRRVDWSLEGDVKVLILALGANDGLRGLPTADLKKNLAAVLDKAKARGVPVILAGMEAPPNNGADYANDFRAVYTDLAKAYGVRFIPFLLQGVAGDAALNQADGIHPNVRGAQIVADLVWESLEPIVSASSRKPQAPSPK